MLFHSLALVRLGGGLGPSTLLVRVQMGLIQPSERVHDSVALKQFQVGTGEQAPLQCLARYEHIVHVEVANRLGYLRVVAHVLETRVMYELTALVVEILELFAAANDHVRHMLVSLGEGQVEAFQVGHVFERGAQDLVVQVYVARQVQLD